MRTQVQSSERLMAIEISALQTAGINLTAINRCLFEMETIDHSKFTKSIEFGQLAKATFSIYDSRQYKQIMRQEGVDTLNTKAKFAQKVLGKSATWCYKAIKAMENLLEYNSLFMQFKQDVADGKWDILLPTPKKLSMDISAWNRYVEHNGQNVGNEEDVPSAEESAEESADKVETVATFSLAKGMFPDGKGVSMRLTADGELTINGDSDKIPSAILESFQQMQTVLQSM